MFLNAVLERNPKLIHTALAFHRDKVIPPNCFLVDLDAVAENASLISQAALKNGLALYFTTKQVGFNPEFARSVVGSGIRKAIAVEPREATVLSQNGIAIGHVGHLGQIPIQMIAPILRLEPEVITVFGVEKAEQISRVAVSEGRQVRFLLRVVSQQDFFYAGQEGGIRLEDLLAAASSILKLPNVQIAGVTSFPCLRFDEASCRLKPTPNLHTIVKAARMLHDGLGLPIEQINAPGDTCVRSMDLLARMGATHGEPGHALTGTAHLHAQSRQPELPALVYVSEISHLYGDRAHIFGGGTYRRVPAHHAVVGTADGRLITASVQQLNPAVIDYYVPLALPPGEEARVGDTVVLASRAQAFVSRAYVGVVKGVQQGNPSFVGLFDAWGRPVERVV